MQPGIVSQACCARGPVVEARGPRVQGHPLLQSVLQAILGYTELALDQQFYLEVRALLWLENLSLQSSAKFGNYKEGNKEDSREKTDSACLGGVDAAPHPLSVFISCGHRMMQQEVLTTRWNI